MEKAFFRRASVKKKQQISYFLTLSTRKKIINRKHVLFKEECVSPILSNTACLISLFSSLYTDAILRKASAVFAASVTST